jgi:hypothetical protein
MMKKFCLMDLINAAALTLGLCVISSQATAAVVCVGTGAVASSCSGVVVNSTTYDVSWALPNYPTGPTPIFSGGTASADASTVADAINAGLNAGFFTNIEYDTGSGTSSAFACTEACYYVPYRINATNVSTWESRYLGNPNNTWYRDPTTSGNLHYPFAVQNLRPVAVFTPTAVVPVPAALPLLLSGITLVGWVGRRRRQGC